MLALYGQFSALIVGRRYYAAQTELNECLEFIREQFNPYDSNAIGIYSQCNEKLGHLPRWLAAVLAPCMDSAQCKLSGVVSGQGNAYATPVKVTLYAPAAMAQVIHSLLGTYWQMWQLTEPTENSRAAPSCLAGLPTEHSDICDSSSPADSAISDDSAELACGVHPAFGQERLLVISTAWGICDWISYAYSVAGRRKASWVVYTREVSLATLESSRAVFVSIADALHALARAGGGYWSKIAVDKTAIGQDLDLTPALATMLDTSTTLYV
ncbi:hypothetical protein GGI00_000076 [Coemansia sp. RSA 2681]|nr:hypothetical protein GGI00_000076 [Coemansia sp. RSA 2681]